MDIQKRINSSISVKQEILNSKKIILAIEESINVITETFKNKGKVLFCGNGGSAADAQHIAAELSGRFYFDREPLPAEAMHVNTSYLTAVANDYSYNDIYSRYLKSAGKNGDVLVGISTSGNSENIVRAFEQAKKMGIKTIALTGEKGGKLKEISDILINVPSNDTPRIQEAHILIGHIICEFVEKNIFE